MFASTNPERERIRAQAILRSFTEYREAVETFAPMSQGEPTCDQGEPVELAAYANRNQGQSILRVFKALRLNRRPVVDEPAQRPTYSPRKVTTSGCS